MSQNSIRFNTECQTDGSGTFYSIELCSLDLKKISDLLEDSFQLPKKIDFSNLELVIEDLGNVNKCEMENNFAGQITLRMDSPSLTRLGAHLRHMAESPMPNEFFPHVHLSDWLTRDTQPDTEFVIERTC